MTSRSYSPPVFNVSWQFFITQILIGLLIKFKSASKDENFLVPQLCQPLTVSEQLWSPFFFLECSFGYWSKEGTRKKENALLWCHCRKYTSVTEKSLKFFLNGWFGQMGRWVWACHVCRMCSTVELVLEDHVTFYGTEYPALRPDRTDFHDNRGVSVSGRDKHASCRPSFPHLCHPLILNYSTKVCKK